MITRLVSKGFQDSGSGQFHSSIHMDFLQRRFSQNSKVMKSFFIQKTKEGCRVLGDNFWSEGE